MKNSLLRLALLLCAPLLLSACFAPQTPKEVTQAFWQAVMDMGIQEAPVEIVEVERHGDTTIEVSTFTLQGEGDTVVDKGKYIVIWRQRGEQCMLHRDILNSSMPPAG